MFTSQTNTGAMVALQMLGHIETEKEDIQNDIATGQEVSSAKDSAALWAVSQLMKTDIAGLAGLSNSISLNEATVSVAVVGAERATQVLQDMKDLAISASSGGVDFANIEKQMAHKTKELNGIISSSQFNGVNLLKTDIDGSGNNSLTVATSLDRQGSGSPSLSTLSIASLDFEGSASFDIYNRTTITDAASARVALAEIEGFIDYAVDGAARLGTASQQLANQNRFLDDLSTSMTLGVSALTDANMEEAATRLIALKVQHQLGMLGLSIANAEPRNLLSLS